VDTVFRNLKHLRLNSWLKRGISLVTMSTLLLSLLTTTLFLSPKPVQAANEPTIDFDTMIDASGLGPWMFDQDATPYSYDAGAGVYAYVNLTWNPDGIGNGSNGSGGSGRASYGTCTAENTSVLQSTGNVTVEFNNFALASIQKKNWGILGQSGDYRVYTGGTATIKVGGVAKLAITNSRISMDVNWPSPVGPGSSISGSGWGTIDPSSDDTWEAEFNNGNGQVEFVFSSFSHVVQSYYGAFASHLTVKGAPHREDLQIIPITSVGEVNFLQTDVSLSVISFVKGGFSQDLNAFMVKRIVSNPGGVPPQGISQIIPACYWEMGTVLSSINASATFNLSSIPNISNPNLLRILKRQDAQHTWTIINDYTLMDATHLRANNLNTFGQFGLGVIPEISPTVTTDNATNITANSARLNGTLTSFGTATSANVSFQYSTASGNYTLVTTPVSVNVTGAFSANLTGLSSNATYFFRATVAGDGTGYGAEKSFTTTITGVDVIRNGDFNSGLDNWIVNPKIPSNWNPLSGGAVDLHPPTTTEFMGVVLYQNLNVQGIGGKLFNLSLSLTKLYSPPSGKTVAVYVTYIDTSNNTQVQKILNPNNSDITQNTLVSANYTFSSGARKIVKISIAAEYSGDFIADNISLTSDGITLGPIPGISSVSGIGTYGSTVTISGTNFGTTAGTVTMGGSPAGVTVNNWSNTSITVGIADPAKSGRVCVIADYVESNIDTIFEVNSPNFTLNIPKDDITVVKGQPAKVPMRVDFYHGFTSSGGINFQMSSSNSSIAAVFTPVPLRNAGGVVLKIDTSGLAAGTYQLTVNTIEGASLQRMATFTLKVITTSDIKFYEYDAGYNKNYITSKSVSQQGSLAIYTEGTDSDGNPLAAPIILQSDNPNLLGVYPSTYSVNIYALQTGSAKLMASTPDGFSANLTVNITVPADPAITSISLTPSQVTNKYTDNLTFYATGTRTIGWEILGMLSNNLKDSTMDWSSDLKSYGGNFKINDADPPGLGTYIFGAYILAADQYTKLAEAAKPLTIVNDPSYSAISVDIISIDPSLMPSHMFNLEFYQGGTLRFTRSVYSMPGLAGFKLGTIPPGTYQIKWVPSYNAIRAQWYPNADNMSAAGNVILNAGQVTQDIYFFPKAAPNLVSIAVVPPNPSIAMGQTLQFRATGTFDDYSTENITSNIYWSSNDSNIATISYDGLATAVAPGTASISASQGLTTGSTILTVTATSLSVITDNATDITTNSARLNGTLTSLGTASSANISFQWGTSSGNFSFETEMVAMNLVGAFSANITGLSANTTYYFQAKAAGESVSYGEEKSFTTLATILPPPSTIYISTTGSDTTGDGSLANPFATIQKGVDTASAGFTIIVRNGTYTQNVNVTKSLNIHSENGPTVTTVVAANVTDHVFDVTASNTTIRGFTIYGTGVTSYKAGIALNQVNNSIVENNYSGTGSTTDNYYGVLIYRGANNQILNNRFIDNSEGILLQGSDNNTISNNYFQYSESRDIHLDYAPYPNGSDNNIIRNNICIDGAGIGIYLNLSNSNQILDNQISFKVGTSGIELYNSPSNTVKGNNISHIQGPFSYGIKIGATGYPSNNNIIYQNTLNSNDTNVYSQGSTNFWQSPTPLTYIYQNHSYTNSLGNYYSNYVGTDNGTGGRTAGDGIGDTSIPVATDGTGDNYPLMATSNNYLVGTIYNLTLAVSPPGSGSTIPAIGTYAFLAGTSVNITATPSASWHFVSWTGSVTNPTSANTTVFMSSNKMATANFATSAIPPIVTTNNATNITTNSARLNGTLTSLGSSTSANVSFQWGLVSGNYTFETTLLSMNSTGAFSPNISGLSANTTYYFRAKAVGDGIGYGVERSFISLATTILPGDATGDGQIDARDITKVERIIAHLDTPTAGSDANLDGFVNALDITRVEMIIVGLD